MMKAKEYAKMYKDNPTDETLCEIAALFVREIDTLIKVRSAKSDSACIAIFKELDHKWMTFSNLTPSINPLGFRFLVERFFPDLIIILEWKA